MQHRHRQLPRMVKIVLLTVFTVLSGCATHCGLFTYCDIPKTWPINDTFIVSASNSELCVSGSRRSSCASRGMFQSGSRTVEIHSIGDEDEDESGELLATLVVSGTPGDVFTANCFQYNGNTVLGFTEVLVGVEILDANGLIVATHPSHTVTRRGGMFFGC